MLSGRVTLIEDKTTDPLFMKVGANYYFYQNDHLGTPQKMTAVNGAVVWSAKYSSFGEATVDAASTITNPLRFPGQFFDAETGLHYNYHRYYDPATGRYLRADPIGLAGMDPNLYGYVKNDPVNAVDPFGLKRVKAFETKQITYQTYYIFFIAPEAELPGDPGFDPYDNHLPDPFIDEEVYYIEVPDDYVLLNTTETHYKHWEIHLTYVEVSHLLITFYWWGCPE